jgi:choline transport protein
MSILAWWISTCSGLSLCAISITGLAAFVNPGYEPHQWHVYLVYVAMALFSGAKCSSPHDGEDVTD